MKHEEESLINDGVIEVLQDALHTTEDDDVQAALWQTLASVDILTKTLKDYETRRLLAVGVLGA